MRCVWLAVATTIVSSAFAEEPCAGLLDAYNRAGKEVSMTWAGTVGDNSTPRHTTANIEINSYLLLKLINLQLLVNPHNISSTSVRRSLATVKL